MFSASAKPGIIQIPPISYYFPEELIVVRKPPRYYSVNVEPSKWQPVEGEGNLGAIDVVNISPWHRKSISVGGLAVTPRSGWGAADQDWKKGVIYYNTKAYPLDKTLDTIIIHHTDNKESIATNESRERARGFAAIGYHFFIDQSGVILEGRPLEIMGSHAGEGLKPGPEFDPDFGAIGIVVQGNYDSGGLSGLFSSEPPAKQLEALEKLVGALRIDYPSIRRVLLHREVKRAGKPTACPGDRMVPHVVKMRDKLGLGLPK